MKRLSNLLCIVLLFFLFSLSGNVQVGGRGTEFPIRGQGLKIGKVGNLHVKGKLPQKISRIQLAGGGFDPLFESEPFPVPQSMKIQAYPSGELGYYIVQFKGPVKQDWKDAVIEAGAKIFDYVPDFAFIVKMGDETKSRVEGMDSVRWVGIYQPGYRVEPQLMRSYVLGERVEAVTLIVVTFREENVNLIVDVLKTMGGTVLDVSENEWKGKIRVQIDSAKIAEIAKIQGVKWIEKAPVWKLFNDVGRGIMNVDPIWSPNNLFGVGQVVAVADTGLDQGFATPANLHDDFEDGEVTPNSRVIQIFDRVGDGADDVNSGHGTHVAGSVLGNGKQSGSDPPGHDYAGSYAGVAPEARLIFQAIENNTTKALTGIPSDLNVLFNQARTAAPTGAHIHTNSWGASAAGAYTSFSEDVDQNAWTNKYFTILFAAGNEGVDSNGDGIIDLYSMGSPATAKNCITVGASENNRPNGSTPTPGLNNTWGWGWPFDYPADPIASDHVSDNSDGMAAFSSRGPCLDGRTKPDVVAPGTNIVSTKSTATTSSLWGQGPDLSGTGYTFSGGTSMSTPLVAGAAALVREFYADQAITPSSALIKATLLNGAFDISPGQYGTGSTQEIPDPPRPNNVEGWGRVDLETSISPAAPRVLQYYDETPGLTTGVTHIYNFEVGDGTVPLKVTLVWTDYPGSPVVGGGLVNDLDLILVDPASTWHYPNNASQRGRTTIISYDDEDYEAGWRFTGPGGGFAVKFTPFSYPTILDNARFGIQTTSTSAQFRCAIWDDDGTGGMPGTSLFSSNVTPPYLPFGGWFTVDISGVTIPDGSFYIELRYTSSGDNNPYLGIDQTAPNNTSYIYDGASWSLLPYDSISKGDWAIQAIVTEQDISILSDRVNNVVGIDIESPATGSYSVRIEGYNIPQGPQPYALVVTGGNVTSLQQVFPPQAPSDLAGQVISSIQVDLSWTDNSGDEIGFRIERRQDAMGTYEEIGTVGANVITYSDTTTIEDRIYYYRVRAYNANGDSVPSNEIGVTTGIPAAPSDLSANAVSYHRIDLTWIDNSVGETGFKIQRKTGATGVWAQIAAVGAEETSYADISCAASITYYYQVFSYNPLGGSVASNEASATTPAAPAFPPIGGGGGGGCFIATAAYGSRMAKDVEVLEKVRDEYLLTNELGRAFVSLYYSYSPPAARLIAKSPMMRKIARIGLYPVVGLSKWFVEAKKK